MITKRNIISLTISMFFLNTGCNSTTIESDVVNPNRLEIMEGEIPVFNFEELEQFLYTNDDNIYLVNFWAMWCAPCVAEMPIIEAFEEANPDVEVLLVSMDFPEDIETKLKPFLKGKGINSKVVILDAPDANSWIDKVNPNWSGAIPYTIIFNKNKRSFHERAFKDLEDLENEVNKTFK